MVQVSFPGVYVREVPSGVRTITGVATSIAAFVGMTRRGPMKLPTRILSFTDYDRIFSTDTSLGETTDQVRQFFQNGGQQAFIVRVADSSAAPATLPVRNVAGTPVLTLTASSDGTDGAQLRAAIDYNSANPERTFNLTIYREILDASGNASVQDTELFKDVSMDSADGRFVEKVVAQGSALATATVATGLTPGKGFSVTALLGAADGTNNATHVLVAAVKSIFDPTTTNTFITGKFQVRVGNRPAKVAVITGTAAMFTDFTGATLVAAIDQAIQDAYGSVTPLTATAIGGVSLAATTPVNSGLAFLQIVAAANGDDVVIDRGPDSDIAQKLGLGTVQGGIEVGAFAVADLRPHPSAYVSALTDTAPLDALLTFGLLLKGDLLDIHLTGAQPFTVLATKISFPVPAGTDRTIATGTVPGASLLNIRENLAAIAAGINSVQTKWRARIHGYRLALIPAFGTATSGTSHVLNGTNTAGAGRWAALTTAPQVFAPPAIAAAAADSFTGGNNGGPPALNDYQKAFDALDSQVDLFNILVLPRTTTDAAAAAFRANIWGPASDFCVQRRAFLVMDADSTKVQDVLTEDLSLRIGLAKDHAGLYWPRVTIPDGNGFTKNIDPSGSIAGIMARIDATRGVWKAPAGLEADVRGIRGVEVPMSDAENGLLNPQAINAIRSFPNGVVSWGARTMDGFDNSGDDDFKYVPVRRFELFLEESVIRGLKFAVFEPNDEPLWAQIRLAVGAFLNTLFRAGAFAGKTPRDAYFVKVDSETTTQNDINLGIVNVLVGFAPLKPAEFIVVTIRQQAGQVQV